MRKMKVGVVGAGAISDIYLKNMIEKFDNLEVVSICANHIESAAKKAEQYGIKAVTMDEMFTDPEIEIVVNLTPVGPTTGSLSGPF
jgi:predicted dehydrogenase